MNRNVKKTIENYHSLTAKRCKNFGALYASEIDSLWALCTQNGTLDIYRLTGNSFEFGFMIGYRAAKREQKKVAPGTRN